MKKDTKAKTASDFGVERDAQKAERNKAELSERQERKLAKAQKAEEKRASAVALIDQEDPGVIDEAVDEISNILQRTVFRGMRQIGEYVLERFYDNDVSLVRSRSHSKHATLRALIKRCEERGLPVSKTFLSNSINIAILIRELTNSGNADDYTALSKSHQIELLPLGLDDATATARLATEAHQEEWSVLQLRQAVREARTKTTKTTSSSVVRTLTSFTAGLAGKKLTARIAWKRLAEGVPSTKLEEAIKMTTKAKNYSEKLLEKLEARRDRES